MNKKAFTLIEILIAAGLFSLVFFMIFMSGSKVNREYYENSECIKAQDDEQNIILGLKPYFDSFTSFSWDEKRHKAFIRAKVGTNEVFLLDNRVVLKTNKGERALSKSKFNSFEMCNNGSIVVLTLSFKGKKVFYFSIK